MLPGIGFSEILVLGLAALIFVGPKDLPLLMRKLGQFIGKGRRMALRHGFGTAGDRVIMIAGVPFGQPGATNLLHVVTLRGDELDQHAAG